MEWLSIAFENIKTIEDITLLAYKFVDFYGLSAVTYVSLNGDLKNKFATSYDSIWVERYIEKNYFLNDPVLDYAKKHFIVSEWSELENRYPSSRHFFGEAREYGVGNNGIVIPIKSETIGVLTMSSNETQREWKKMARGFIGQWLSIAYVIHSKANLALNQYQGSKLSFREKQCLREVARGRLAKQIAFDLGISESAVRLYLASARHKLDAITLSHAVGIATSTDLIRI